MTSFADQFIPSPKPVKGYMISKTVAFKIGDEVFQSIADAQIHALKQLLENVPNDADSWASHLVQNSEKVVDILTTTPNSKPRARKINGGKKARKQTTSPELTSALNQLKV